MTNDALEAGQRDPNAPAPQRPCSKCGQPCNVEVCAACARTSNPVSLPTWEECKAKVDAETATPLEAFIYENEPALTEKAQDFVRKCIPNYSCRADEQFRGMLAALIAFVRTPDETKARHCEKSVDGRHDPNSNNECVKCGEYPCPPVEPIDPIMPAGWASMTPDQLAGAVIPSDCDCGTFCHASRGGLVLPLGARCRRTSENGTGDL